MEQRMFRFSTTIIGMGLYLAAITYGVWLLAVQWTPPLLAVVIALVVGAVVTRGTHAVIKRVYPRSRYAGGRVTTGTSSRP
jgi:hypothetical protein